MTMAAASVPRLSKGRYLAGLQCAKRLFLEVRAPHLAAAPDDWSEGLLALGLRVGEVARGRFPGGVIVEQSSPADALRRTVELVADPGVPALFEGCFEHGGLVCRVDVLARARGAWQLIEVKSATGLKDEYLDDVAVQAHVLAENGLPLAGLFVLHLDADYVYPGGEPDLQRLFRLEEVSAEAAAARAAVPARAAAMRAMLAGPEPSVEPGHHCHHPVSCPFWDHCTAAKPARWIFHLPGGCRPFDALAAAGVQTIDEIPDDFPLTAVQRRVKDNVEWISAGLREALDTIRYPVHHLDFETVAPGIPRYPHTRPYQTIPFQWSNHIETRDGSVRHQAHLGTGREDPREAFALDLLESVGTEGSICVYSGYEERILHDLAVAIPRLQRELHALIERLWDLLPVIRSHYYHPGFHGSFSIKSTLPALVPSLAYDDLEIRDGGTASLQFYRMVFETEDPAEKAKIRESLLRYCQRDTLAMVELRRALRAKAITPTV
jgi:predicted RecB family nuclease